MKHGCRGTPTYNAWDNLRARFPNRCEEWSRFDRFLQDMGPKPDGCVVLKVLDRSKPPNKENCCWAHRTRENGPGYKHGGSGTKTYKVWSAMIQRTRNPNAGQYSDYGGRGIAVCDDWHSFAGFRRDMGDAPKGMTLDRIDNDKGYSKDNCRWASREQQSANRRVTVRIRHEGADVTITELARILNVTKRSVYSARSRGRLQQFVERHTKKEA